MSSVFVDTSALYALFSRFDARHGEARNVLRELHRRRSPLITTDLVLFETYVLAHARGGLGALLELRSALIKSTWMQTIGIASEHQAEAWSFLEQRRDKGYSFVVAVSFVVMRALGIRRAFAFDADFAREGFALLGGRANGT